MRIEPQRCPCTRHQSGRLFALMAVLVLGAGSPIRAVTINGFEVSDTSVPAVHIVRAAPARDSIAAIDEPRWDEAAAATWLKDEDEVLSLTFEGETRAYPLRILVWHEVVNDRIGERTFVVTYSALSGSAMAFESGRNPDGSPRRFGVSGLLYNSNLLMFDRATESLWSQLRMAGVSGATKDEQLIPLPLRRMTWAGWKAKFPQGRVLAVATGSEIDYTSEDWPYGDYARQKETLFPFDIHRDDLGTKERVIGLREGDSQRCWPLERMRKRGQLYDAIGSRPINVVYDATTGDVVVSDLTTGEVLPVVSVFWFAWQAFYPDTSLWLPLR